MLLGSGCSSRIGVSRRYCSEALLTAGVEGGMHDPEKVVWDRAAQGAVWGSH